ncbi:MAG TPA: ferritin-like domain-containing protein [Alphaproteobacteria bacterium]|nr:ferritin-like domain-containing protein [Alphaproteobacteria bacterium]USO06715.1 MAG: ferritin-like domain-containing protein [Rhodospirillales bacterium]HOO81252.1 ferritin-like domain-containing protein [Alphaproteobacteria bacterium]
MITLCEAAMDVLSTPEAVKKAEKTRQYAQAWRAGDICNIGHADLPARPARSERPQLLAPKDMPKRAKAGSPRSKIALLHALAHIELNAIDLAWDVMARGFDLGGFTRPKDFYDDWVKVADDEAKHHLMLEERLNALGASYGDLPAHDGLWESSEKTAHDFAARLAIVPMVLEARGLDVTPGMIAAMEKQGDTETAHMLQIIHDDEITHVRAGTRWFEAWCAHHGKDVEETWQDLVRTYFNGQLKRPFNHPSREEAGMIRDWYEPLAEALNDLEDVA